MENCKEAEETGEEPQFTAPASYDSVGPLSLAVKVTCGLAPCPSLHPTFNLSAGLSHVLFRVDTGPLWPRAFLLSVQNPFPYKPVKS